MSSRPHAAGLGDGSSHQGLEELRAPSVTVAIVGAEVGSEVPVGPGQVEAVELAPDPVRPANTRVVVGGVDRAELADVAAWRSRASH